MCFRKTMVYNNIMTSAPSHLKWIPSAHLQDVLSRKQQYKSVQIIPINYGLLLGHPQWHRDDNAGLHFMRHWYEPHCIKTCSISDKFDMQAQRPKFPAPSSAHE